MMLKYILFTLVGFYLLIKGADLFVDGIASISTNLKIPKLIISLSVVAFGTSTPELFISFKSLLNGNNDIVMANVVGSTIVNTMLIIGVSALIKPIKIKSETIKKQLPLHLMIILFFSLLFLDKTFNNTINTLSRSDAIILFIIFLSFVVYIYKYAKSQNKEDIKEEPKWSLSKSIIFGLIGLICIAFGSEIAVNNCVNIANALHVSQKIITMFILVLGTSMPELIMAITSVRKGEYDIIMGNIIGTNIFNIGFVLTLPVIVFGGLSTTSFNFIDMFMMLIAGLTIYIFAKDDRKLDKLEGFIMIILFMIYYAYMLLF